MKTKTITVEFRPVMGNDGPEDGYTIRSVTDSVEFRPGTSLTKTQVNDLCNAKDWKVTIK